VVEHDVESIAKVDPDAANAVRVHDAELFQPGPVIETVVPAMEGLTSVIGGEPLETLRTAVPTR